MDFVFIIAAFLSVVPLMLLLSAKTVPEYAQLAGRLSRFFPHRMLSLAVVLGGVVGVGSALLTLPFKAIFFQDVEHTAKASEALTWTVYIAFIYAGLAEEVVKCLLALGLALLAGSAPRAGGGRVFLKATPFLCGAVGMGFALLENFDYLRYPIGLPSMLLARGLLAAPIHTAINFNFGLTLYRSRGENLLTVVPLALAVATLQHGLYDFFAIPSGAFSQFLTLVATILIVTHVLKRMYALLPETRHRLWRERPAESEDANEDESDEAQAGGAWELSPSALRFFEQGLLRDEHRKLRPPARPPPFREDEFPFPAPALREAFLKYEYAGPLPEADAEYRAYFEAKAREAFAPAAAYVWDTAVFAENIEGEGNETYRALQSMGIELTKLAPLRVLEFSPTGALPGAYRYLSCGLGPLLGRELLLSFPHPFSPARIFFTAVSAGLFPEPPADFRALPVEPHLLGDPRGWFRAVLPVPLLDPVRDRLVAALDGRCPLPAEILYLNRPDLRLVRRYGVQNYFAILKEAGESWFNDFLRSPIEVREEK